jgi:thiosulfate reductase cytochrome b subunit
MTGAFHLRVAAGILMTFAVVSAAPEAMLFYYGYGSEIELPLGSIMGCINLLLAVFLLRGSNVASYVISIISILYLGGGLVGLPKILEGVRQAAWIATWLLVTGYLWWAVTFSKKVRAELARRREGNKIRDREARRKFYRETRETTEAKDAV